MTGRNWFNRLVGLLPGIDVQAFKHMDTRSPWDLGTLRGHWTASSTKRRLPILGNRLLTARLEGDGVTSSVDCRGTASSSRPNPPEAGAAYLKALAGPIPDFRFCPTGGIDLAGAPDFLALPNVACVGGSWITPKDAVAAGDWTRIESLAREAAKLGTT